MRDGIIYWRGQRREQSKWKVVLPASQRKEVIRRAHDEWGHKGVARTTALVKSNFSWPGLQEDVKRYVTGCKTCIMAKDKGPVLKLSWEQLTNKPWEVLAMDFTVLDPARDGKENVLNVTDVFNKFVLAFPTNNQKASTVAKVLVEMFNMFGCPERVHSG